MRRFVQIMCLVVSALSFTVSLATTRTVQMTKAVNGGGIATLTYDDQSSLMTSFRFPTSYGDVIGIVAGQQSSATVDLQLEGTTNAFRVVATDQGGGTVRFVTTYSPQASITYDVANGLATLVSTTVQDCGPVENSQLFLAVVELHSAVQAMAGNYKVVPSERTYFNAIDVVATMFDSAPRLVTTCVARMSTWGRKCSEDSPDKGTCYDCCERVRAIDIMWFGGACALVHPLLGVACGGIAYLEFKHCQGACDEAFPPNPPVEGSACGTYPQTGTCASTCPPPHEVVKGYCSIAMVCCH